MASKQKSACPNLGPLQAEFDKIQGCIEDIRQRAWNERSSSSRVESAPSGYSPWLASRPTFEPWTFATDQPYNVVSILGSRGSGKTTLLLATAKYRMQDGERPDAAGDMVLMPIQPERFHDYDTVLGWVLAGLGKWVDWLDATKGADCGLGRAGYGDEKIEDVLREEERDSLKVQYRRLRQVVMRSKAGIHDYLKQCQDDAWEFGEEVAQVAADGYHLRLLLRRFLDKLFSLYDQAIETRGDLAEGPLPLLVVPIDDADLNRDKVWPVLAELTILATHPRVVVLLGGHWETFAHAIRTQIADAARDLFWESQLDSAVHPFKAFQESYVARLLTKYLPNSARIILEELTLAERLEFIPFEDQMARLKRKPFVDILDEVAFTTNDESKVAMPTLAHYFDFAKRCPAKEPGQVIPSMYAEILPASPRDLVQLYRRLEAAAARYKQAGSPRENVNATAPASSSSITAQQVKDVWNALVCAIAPEEKALLDQVVRWASTSDEVHVRLDYGALRTGRTTGRGRVFRMGGGRTIDVRQIADFFVAIDQKAQRLWAATKDADGDVRASQPFQKAVLLTSEFAEGGFGLESGVVGRNLATPGGEAWNSFVTVRIRKKDTEGDVPQYEPETDDLATKSRTSPANNMESVVEAVLRRGSALEQEETDGLHWALPKWDSYVDYMLYARAWNPVVAALQSCSPDWTDAQMKDERANATLDWVFLRHLEILLDVQESRTLRNGSPDPWKRQTGLLNARTKDPTIGFDDCKDRCLEILNSVHTEDDIVRERDFVSWFAIVLPWAADGLTITEELGKRVLDLWASGIQKIDEFQPGSTRQAIEALAKRVRANLNKYWTENLIGLVGKLGDDKGASILFQKWTEATKEDPKQLLDQYVAAIVGQGGPREPLSRLRILGPRPEIIEQLERELPPELCRDLMKLAHAAFPETDRSRTIDERSNQ